MIEARRVFAKEDGDGISFLARRATSHPDPDVVVLFLAREKLRDVRLEGRERFPVAEEMRHADEQILEQGAPFGRVLAKEIEILRDAFERVDLETARDPAQDGSALVVRKIVPGLGAEIGQDFADRLFVGGIVSFLRDRLAAGGFLFLHVRLFRVRDFGRQFHPPLVADELEQPRWHLPNGQNPIDHPGADRRHRHAVVFGLVRVLRDRDPALGANVFQPDRTI